MATAGEHRSSTARCCVVGAGPAGLMVGFLLARAGIDVVVLEKHDDFFRDFRGDTIHPSTMRVLDDLGLLDAFLALPHAEAREIAARFGASTVPIADFGHSPGRSKFLAFMPQWDFLTFLATEARKLPNFRLEMGADTTDLVRLDGRVVGVRATTASGTLAVDAALVIGADGRRSVLRRLAEMTTKHIGAPIDVLWLRLSRRSSDPTGAFGSIGPGALLVTIARDTYFQCGLVIAKDGIGAMKALGLPALGARIAALAPFLHDRIDELQDWDQVKLLTVAIDRLATWYVPGLLFIGDAAHAMSPVGGVGINLAIADAVATANLLARPLRAGGASVTDLARVQRRRELPTRLTQSVQVFVQRTVLTSILASRSAPSVPPLVRVLAAIPFLRRIPAYAIGFGVRPERVNV